MGIDKVFISRLDLELKKYSRNNLLNMEVILWGPSWFLKRRMYLVGIICFFLHTFSSYFLAVESSGLFILLFNYGFLPELILPVFLFFIPFFWYFFLNSIISIFSNLIYKRFLKSQKIKYLTSYNENLKKILVPDNKKAVAMILVFTVFSILFTVPMIVGKLFL